MLNTPLRNSQAETCSNALPLLSFVRLATHDKGVHRLC